MNSRTRKRLYPLLVKRDGERCAICRGHGTTLTLVIDHVDNDNSNNDPANVQLVCRKCNLEKNPRGGLNQSPIYVDTNAYESRKRPSPELQRNMDCEPAFRRWLYRKVKTKGRIEFHDAVNAGAEKAGCSQATIVRYIQKVTSSEGIYQVVPDLEGEGKFIEFSNDYLHGAYPQDKLLDGLHQSQESSETEPDSDCKEPSSSWKAKTPRSKEPGLKDG